MHKQLFFAAVWLVAGQAMAAPQTDAAWDCKFASRTLCTANGCSAIKGQTWIYLTPSQQSYWRCEGAGFDDCHQYKATVTDSGEYKILELTGHAGFAKVGPSLDVIEVLSLMDGVWINRGRCMVGPPPLVRVR